MNGLFRNDLKYNLERAAAGRRAGAEGRRILCRLNMKGPMLSKRVLYFVDPEGALGVAPDEVGLLTSADGSYDTTMGFHNAGKTGGERTFAIPVQDIDTAIARNGGFKSQAVSRVVAMRDGLRVLRLNLFPTLRMGAAYGPQGEGLDVIQEDKDRDADLAVVLPHALKKGEQYDVTTVYAGKDSLLDAGNGNYYPVPGARDCWYPNVRGDFDNYADYHMTFRIPKEYQVVATGSRVKEHTEGQQLVSEWQTDTPIPVAGFSMGDFKSYTTERGNVQIISYANVSSPEDMIHQGMADASGMLGALNTTGMLNLATSEGEAAVKIYTEYFGPLDFDHVSLVQQTACTYGQSWPMMVYLPICYFFDSTTKHTLGLLDHDRTYWKVVTPHEVAHQWWGQTVGFGGYHDQWMSEGFADFSASIFLLETNEKMDAYHEFWKNEKELLLTKDQFGFWVRPVDAGPITMGTRLNTSRTGDDTYQKLIYPKGALHPAYAGAADVLDAGL